jgi:hypothetical protein
VLHTHNNTHLTAATTGVPMSPSAAAGAAAGAGAGAAAGAAGAGAGASSAATLEAQRKAEAARFDEERKQFEAEKQKMELFRQQVTGLPLHPPLHPSPFAITAADLCLCCAVLLCCVVLCCAVLCCAVLCCVVLCGVVCGGMLCCAMLSRAVLWCGVVWCYASCQHHTHTHTDGCREEEDGGGASEFARFDVGHRKAARINGQCTRLPHPLLFRLVLWRHNTTLPFACTHHRRSANRGRTAAAGYALRCAALRCFFAPAFTTHPLT